LPISELISKWCKPKDVTAFRIRYLANKEPTVVCSNATVSVSAPVLYPDLPELPEQPAWNITTGPYGNLVLSAQISTGNKSFPVQFDLGSMQVKDETGRVFSKLKIPSAGVLNRYYEMVERKSLPTVARDCTGTYYLVENPLIQFSGTHWVDKSSGKMVYGLRAP